MAAKLGISLVLTMFALSSVTAQTGSPCIPSSGEYEIFITLEENNAEIGHEFYHVDIPGNASEVLLTSNYNEYFAFNSSTRMVWVNGTVDAEVSMESERLTITCRELALQDTAPLSLTLIIFIADSNDNAPVFTNATYTFYIGEMTEVGTVIERIVSATDADKQPPNNSIFYSILPGPYANYFIIINPVIATLTLSEPLDFEKVPRFSITLMAEDQAQSGPRFNATCVVEFIVEDEDDQYPVFNSSVYEAFIADTTQVNSVVNIRPAIAAYDPDRSLNAGVVYSFHDPKGQSRALLSIDPETAEVRLTSAPTSKEVYLLLQATQTDNPSRYGVALLSVQVQGANVNRPVFFQDDVRFVRTEAFPVGEVIGSVMATDPDLGSLVTYSMDEASKNSFSLNENTGDITLVAPLNYADRAEHVLTVTASDGNLESSGRVTIRVVPVNNKPPVILTSGSDLNVSAVRRRGSKVADITVEDDGQSGTALTYRILTHSNLFAIDNQGQITVAAPAADLDQDMYQIAVVVESTGQPRYSTATAVTVSFPALTTPVVGAQMAESDSILPVVFGAIAAVLLVTVVILIIYICKRRLREKEHLDRAKKQLPSQDAKALAFKKQGTLGRQARANIEFGEDQSDGDTTIQENPLSSAGKGGYYNFGQVYSDTDTNTEVDMSEIHVETSVTPYDVLTRNDDNNNDNIYNNSQMSEESEDYPPSEKQAITSFFRNGSLSTYRDSSDSELSLNTSPSDSHDSKKNLVSPSALARSRVPEEESVGNGLHPLPGASDTANLDPDSSVVPASQKQELTVYF